MDVSVKRYIHGQLGTTGFVLIGSEIAIKLRPDIFTNVNNCSPFFARAKYEIHRLLKTQCKVLFRARFPSFRYHFIGGAMSRRALAERIEDLMGERPEIEWINPDALPSVPEEEQGFEDMDLQRVAVQRSNRLAS